MKKYRTCRKNKQPRARKSAKRRRTAMRDMAGMGVWGAVIVVVVVYLFLVNTRAIAGYELEALDEKLVEWRERTAQLNVRAEELSSLERVRRVNEEKLQLVKVQEIEYARAVDSQVARR